MHGLDRSWAPIGPVGTTNHSLVRVHHTWFKVELLTCLIRRLKQIRRPTEKG